MFCKVVDTKMPAQNLNNNQPKNTPLENRPFLSVSKAASYLKVSPSTLRRLENEGKITAIRQPNGYRMFNMQELAILKASLETHKVQSETLKKQHQDVRVLKSSVKNSGFYKLNQTIRDINLKNKGAALALAILLLAISPIILAPVGPSNAQLGSAIKLIPSFLLPKKAAQTEVTNVLGERDQQASFEFNVNIPTNLTSSLNVEGDTILAGSLSAPSVLGVTSIDLITQNTLENTLTVSGDVTGPLNNVQLSEELTLDGTLNIGGVINITGEVQIDGDAGSSGQVLTSTGSGVEWADVETDADTLDSLDSTAFLRSNVSDIYTSGTLSFSNGTFLDLSAITHGSTAAQGFKLPQATTLTAPSTGEGFLAYDTDAEQVLVYNGTTWANISGAATTLQEAYTNGETIQLSAGESDLRIFNDSSSEMLFFDESSGFLGIGTTSPTTKLDLAGTLNVSGNATFTSFVDLSSITHSTTTPQGLRLPQADTLSSPASGEGYLAYDTDADKIYIYNGTSWTDVSGASTTLQEAYEAGNTALLSAAQGDIRFYNDGGDEMLFLDESNGRIGIGTTSPSYKLSVNGDIEIASGSELYSYGSATLGNRTYTEDNYVTDGQTFTDSINLLDQQLADITGGTAGLWRDAGTYIYANNFDSMVVTDSGRIGIGTTAPSYELDVTGALRATGQVYFSGLGTSTSENTIIVQNGSGQLITREFSDFVSDDLIASGNGGTNFVPKWSASQTLSDSSIFDNGINVGIGSSSPSDTLHVLGNVLATTGFHVGVDGDGTLIDDASNGASSTTLYIGNESILASGDIGVTVQGYDANTSLLGSSIEGSEITDGTIEEVDLEITNAGTDNYILSYDNATGGFTWVDPTTAGAFDGTGTANYLTKWTDGDTLSSSVIYETGGNIGIGTTDPAKKLHITGSDDVLVVVGDSIGSNTYPSLYIGNTNGNSGFSVGQADANRFAMVWRYNATAASAYADFVTAGYSNPIRIDGSVLALQAQSGGNVGIGTTSPTDTLHVVGNALATTGFHVGVDSTDNLIDDATNGSGSTTLYIGNESILASGDIGVSVQGYNANTSLLGSSIEGSEITDNTIEEVDLEVTNSATDNYLLSYDTATGGFTWVDPTGSGVGSIDGSGTANYLTKWTDDNTLATSVIYETGGQLGVGTTAPASTLHVVGDFTTDNVNINGNTIAATTSAGLFLNDDSGNPNTGIFIEDGGNVGIGTTNPGTTLNVYSGYSQLASFQRSSASTGRIDISGAGTTMLGSESTTGGTIFGGTSGYASVFGTQANSPVQFATSNATRLTITGGGDVGIGTTDPTAMLSLASADNAAGGIAFGTDTNLYRVAANTLRTDDTFQTASGFRGSSLQAFGANDNLSLTSKGTGDVILGNESTTYMTITDGGLVGIGTTAPGNINLAPGFLNDSSSKILEIRALSTSRDAGIFIRDLDNAGVDLWVDGNTNKSYFDILTNDNTLGLTFRTKTITGTGTDVMTILGGGNVGIGTTGPSSTLHVVGDFTTDNININGNTIAATTSAGLFLNDDSGNPNTGLFIEDGGNVGIGTTNPSQKLMVNGNVTPTSNLAGSLGAVGNYWNASYIYGINFGGGNIDDTQTITSASSYDLSLYSRAGKVLKLGSNNTPGQVELNAGNLGIGITSPTYKLDVAGDIRIEDGSELYSFGSATLGNRTYTEDNYVTDAQTFTASIDALDQQLADVVGGVSGLWTDQGTYIQPSTLSSGAFVISDSGNVGIGTTAPGSSLTIAHESGPQLRFDNGGTDKSWSMQSVSTAGSASNFYFSDIADSKTPLALRDAVGFVAINPTPASVINNTAWLGQLSVYVNDSTRKGLVIRAASSQAENLLEIQNSSSTELVVVDETGNVGIGTTNPSDTLHVVGNALATTGFHVGVDSTDNLIDDATNGSGSTTLYIGNESILASGDIGVSVQGYDANTSLLGSSIEGSEITDGTIEEVDLEVTNGGSDNYLLSYDLATGGFTWVDPTSAGSLDGTGTANYIPLWSDSNTFTNSSLYETGGQIGIGTTSPSSTLHIVGDLAVDNLNLNGNTLAATSAAGLFLLDDSGNPNTGIFVEDGGNVGIGTTNPAYDLHIAGNGQQTFMLWNTNTSTPSYKHSVANATDTYDSFAVGAFGGTAGVPYVVGVKAGLGYYISKGADYYLTINSTGSVGIGTTNPTDTLHVVGSALATTGFHVGVDSSDNLIDDATNGSGSTTLYIGNESILASGDIGVSVQGYDANTSILGSSIEGSEITDNTIEEVDLEVTNSATDNYLLSYDTSTGGFTWVDPTSAGSLDGTGTANYIPLWSDSNTFTNSSLYETGGQIGIGTTGPSSTLHVVGDFTTDNININGNTIAATTSAGLFLNEDGGNGIFVEDGGYVGIGTADPAQLLDVRGTVDISNGGGTGLRLGQKQIYGLNNNKLYVDTASDTSGGYRLVQFQVQNGSYSIWQSVPVFMISPQVSINWSSWYTNDDTEEVKTTIVDRDTDSGLSLGFLTDDKAGIKGHGNAQSLEVQLPTYFTTGNVGIGTTSPTDTLHVVGNALATTGFHVGVDSTDNLIDDATNGSGSTTLYIGNESILASGDIGVSVQGYDANTSLLGSSIEGSEITDNTIEEVDLEVTNGGSDNYLLSYDLATGGFTWVDPTSAGSLDGTGTANYIPLWSDSNTFTNSSLYETGGQIGIGTTSPSSTLHIVGDLAVDNLNLNGNTLAATSAAGLFLNDDSGNPNTGIFVEDGGNVGIGTTNPSVKLDVNGVVKIAQGNYLEIGGYTTRLFGTYLQLYGDTGGRITSTATGNLSIGDGTDVNIFVQNDGNVGIGTTGPTDTLHVVGSALATTGFHVGVDSTDNLIDDATNGSGSTTLYIGNESILASGDIGVTVQGYDANTSLLGSSIEGSEITDNTIEEVDLEVTNGGSDNYLLSYDLATGGFTWVDPTTAGSLDGTGTANYIPLWSDSNTFTNSSLYETGGQIGIGTTAPSSTLHIVGDFTTDNVNINGNTIAATTSAGLFLNDDSGNPNTGIFIEDGGNVGIGTTDPIAKLHIASGGIFLDHTQSIRGGTSSTVYNGIQLYNGGNGNMIFNTQDVNKDFVFVTPVAGTTELFRIKGTGSVGIGTTNPTDTLHIVGNALATTGFHVGVDSTDNLIDDASNGSGSATLYIGNESILASGDIGISVQGYDANTSLLGSSIEGSEITDNTIEEVDLEVTNSATDNYLLSYDTATGGFTWVDPTGSGVGSIDGSGTANYITKWTDDNTLATSVIYETGGEIGIGTTAPEVALDVYGKLSLGSNAPADNTLKLYYDRNDYSGVYGSIQHAGISGGLKILSQTETGSAAAGDITFWTSTTSSAATEKIRLENTGFLGIGSTNPSSLLSVGSGNQFQVDSSGDIVKINNITYAFPDSQAGADNYVLTNDGNGTLTWESVLGGGGLGAIDGTGTANYVPLWSDTDTLTSSVIYQTGGLLGIGTTSPSELLHVASSGGDSAYFEGEVGIGAANPTTKLSVHGNNTTAGGISVWNGSGTDYGGYIYGTNSFPTNGGLIIQGKGNSASGVSILSDAGKGLVLAPGRNSVGTLGNFSTGSIYMVAADASTDILRWADSSENLLGVINSSGEVGIGTTSPSSTLHVVGDFTTDNVNINGNTIAATTSAGLFLNEDGGAGIFVEDGGNVGIGTTNPSSKLHVATSGTSGSDFLFEDSSAGAVLEVRGTGSNNVTLKLTRGSEYWSFFDDAVTGDDLQILFNGVEKMRIDAASGNVGIGSTSPTDKLHVEGSALATTGFHVGVDSTDNLIDDATNGSGSTTLYIGNESILTSGDIGVTVQGYDANTSLLGSSIEGSEITDGTIEEVDLEVTNAASDNYILSYDDATGGFTWVDPTTAGSLDGTGTANYIPLWSDSNTFTDSSLYETGGQIGIGTTSPSSTLHIVGDFTTDNVNINGNTIAATTSAGLFLLDDSGNPNSGIFVEDGGNVGIGTTDPSAKLSFAESTTAAGGINFGGDVNLYRSATDVLNTDDVLHIKKAVGTNISDFPYKNLVLEDTTSAAANVGGAIAFYGNYTGTSATTAAGIRAMKSNGTPGDYGFDLGIFTRVNGGNTTEKLRVTSTGNVGIGTTAPTDELHVVGNVLATTGFHVGVDSTDNLIDDATNGSGSTTLYIGNESILASGDIGVTVQGYDVNTSLLGSSIEGSEITDGTIEEADLEVTNGGSDNYLLSYDLATGGFTWVDPTSAGSLDGTGTANYIPLWSDSNTFTDSSLYETGGQIGIGTTSPAQKLDIMGGIKVHQSNDANEWGTLIKEGAYLTLESLDRLKLKTNNADVLIIESSGDFDFNSGDVYFKNSGGSVGIGTTNPQSKLQIGSVGSADGYLSVGGSVGQGIVFGSNAGIIDYRSSYFDFNSYSGYFAFTTGVHDEKLRITNSGNVGIGTTNPSDTLHIVGNALATTGFHVGVDSTDNLIDDATNGSGSTTLYIGNESILASGDIGVTVQGYDANTSLLGSSIEGSEITDGTIEEADLEVTNGGSDNYLLSYDLATGGFTWVDPTGSGVGSIDGSGTANYLTKWTDDNTLAISALYETGGQIGIGTTSPSSTLHVVGDFTTDNVNINGNTIAATTAAGLFLNDDSGNPNTGIFVEDGGNVGIGTTDPAARLDVRATISHFGSNGGNFYINNNTLNFAYNSTGNSEGYINYTGYQAGTTDFRDLKIADGKQNILSFFDGSSANVWLGGTTAVTSPVLAIQGTGNVGIGNTNPTYKLDVAGDIRIENGSELYSFGSATLGNRTYTEDNYVTDAQTFTASIDALDQQLADVVGGVSGIWTDQGTYIQPSTLSSGAFAIQDDGDVGIGTTSPGAILEVSGAPGTFRIRNTAGGSTYTEFKGSISGVDNNGLSIIQNGQLGIMLKSNGYVGVGPWAASASPASVFGVYGNAAIGTGYATVAAPTNGLIVQGNVGIGTTNPGQELEVVGDIELSGRIIAGNGSKAAVAYGFDEGGDTGMYLLSDNNLMFSTGNAERVLINSSGNVGIGTTDPKNKLHVAGRITSDFGTKAGVAYGFDEGGDTGMYLLSDNNLAFSTANADRILINSSGNVGIGTTLPTDVLHVVGQVLATTGFHVGVDSTDNLIDDATNGSGSTTLYIGNESILASGDIGVSVQGYDANTSLLGSSIEGSEITDGTIEEVDLEVTNSPTDNYILSFDNTSGGFTWVDPTSVGSIDGSGTAGYTSLWSDSNTLTSSSIYETGGQIGIGTTAPSSPLHVSSSTGGSSVTILGLQRTASPGNSFTNLDFINSRGIAESRIGSYMTSDNVVTPAAGLSFFTVNNNTTLGERMTITSAGNVGIGTTSPTDQLHVVGSAFATTGFHVGVDSTDNLIDDATNGSGSTTLYIGNESILASGDIGVSVQGYNANTSLLGSSIEGSEITDGTIEEADLEVTNATTDNYILSFDDATGGFTWVDPTSLGAFDGSGTANYLTKWTDSNTLAISALYETGGFIGLGTTAPSTILDVVGSITLENDEVFGNATDDIITFTGVGGSDNTDLYINLDGTRPIIYSNTDSKVEINDDLIIYDYIGTNRNSVNAIDLYNNGIAIASYLSAEYGLDNDNNDSTEAYVVNTNGGQSRLMTVAQDGGGGGSANASLGINDITPDAHLEISANGTTGGAMFMLSSNDDTNGDLFYVAEAGTIGIGTTSPTAYLDIAASTTSNASLRLRSGTEPSSPNSGDLWWNGASLNFYNGSTTTDLLAGGGTLDGSGTANYISLWSDSNTLTSSGIYETAGQLGIGTTAPSSLLHVAGTLTATTLDLGTNTITDGNFSGAWNFNAGAVSGITTLSASSTIDFDGLALDSDEDSIVVHNADGTLSYREFSDFLSDDGIIDGVGTAGYITKYSDTNTLTNSVIYETASKIGIGTSNPSGTLHVYNSTGGTAQNILEIGDSTGIYTSIKNSDREWWLGMTSIEDFVIYDRGSGTPIPLTIEKGTPSNTLYIDSNARIGIGTTNPTALLSFSSGNTDKIHFGQSDLGIGVGNAETDLILWADAAGKVSFADGSRTGTVTAYVDFSNNTFNVGSAAPFSINNSGAITAATGITSSGTITFSGLGTGTDDSVVILNGSNQLTTDEIDTRVWGTTLLDSSAGVANYLPIFSDGDTLGLSSIYETGGLIGIGTTAPGSILDVVGSITLENDEVFGNATDDIITLVGVGGADNTDLYIDLDGTSPVIYSNTDDTVTINDKLQIAQYLTTSANSVNNINMQNNGMSVESYLDFKIQLDNDQGDTAEQFTLLTNGAQSLLWAVTQDGGGGSTASGNMSVNDSTPDAHLEISANGTTGGSIFMLSSSDDTDGDIFYVAEAGDVGIGTTSPAAKLDVVGTLQASSTVTFTGLGTGTDNSVLVLNSSNQVVTDEIDSRVWGTTLVDASSGTANYLSKFSDGDTLINSVLYESSSKIGIGTTAPNYVLDLVSSDTTGVLEITGDSVTTGTGALFSFDALTSGTGILVESNPGSATTLSGDLFRINVGSNLTVTGDIFSIDDNGSELFSVNQAGITSAIPHSFTAAGDVSMAYDLIFTNQTSSKIESYGPFTIEVGESNESNDLNLTTYNSGNIYANLGSGSTATSAQLLVSGDVSDFLAGFTNDGNADTRKGLFVQACLDTNPTTACNLMEFRDGNGTVIGAIEGNGAGGVTAASGGSDYAELFNKDTSTVLEAGDIIALDAKGKAVKASSANKLLGAYSNNPNTLGNWFDGWENNSEVVPVGLLGQLNVKVSYENGRVMSGDPIAVSPTKAGRGVKSLEAQRVLGFAMADGPEEVDSKTGYALVKVYINPTWYDPTMALGAYGELKAQVSSLSGTLAGVSSSSTSYLTIEDLTPLETELDVVKNDIALINELLGITNTYESSESSESSATTTLNGLSNLVEELLSVYEEFKGFVEALGMNIDSASDTLNINVDLNVLGDTTLTNVTVAGDLSVGQLEFDSLANSINVLGASCYNADLGTHNEALCDLQTLSIQSDLSGNVDFFNGAILLEPDGTLNTTKFAINVAEEESASAGKAIIPAGATFIEVHTSALSPNSLILITPDKAVAVGKNLVDEDTFAIELESAQTEDITVDWLLVELNK